MWELCLEKCLRVHVDINFLPYIGEENHSWSLYKYFTSRYTLCNEESYDLQHQKSDIVFIYRLLMRCSTLKLPALISVWSGTKGFVCVHFPPLISLILQARHQSSLLSFLSWPLLATHCRGRVLLHVITLGDTLSVGLLWTRDRPVAETSTWQHKTSATSRHHTLFVTRC